MRISLHAVPLLMAGSATAFAFLPRRGKAGSKPRFGVPVLRFKSDSLEAADVVVERPPPPVSSRTVSSLETKQNDAPLASPNVGTGNANGNDDPKLACVSFRRSLTPASFDDPTEEPEVPGEEGVNPSPSFWFGIPKTPFSKASTTSPGGVNNHASSDTKISGYNIQSGIDEVSFHEQPNGEVEQGSADSLFGAPKTVSVPSVPQPLLPKDQEASKPRDVASPAFRSHPQQTNPETSVPSNVEVLPSNADFSYLRDWNVGSPSARGSYLDTLESSNGIHNGQNSPDLRDYHIPHETVPSPIEAQQTIVPFFGAPAITSMDPETLTPSKATTKRNHFQDSNGASVRLHPQEPIFQASAYFGAPDRSSGDEFDRLGSTGRIVAASGSVGRGATSSSDSNSFFEESFGVGRETEIEPDDPDPYFIDNDPLSSLSYSPEQMDGSQYQDSLTPTLDGHKSETFLVPNTPKEPVDMELSYLQDWSVGSQGETKSRLSVPQAAATDNLDSLDLDPSRNNGMVIQTDADQATETKIADPSLHKELSSLQSAVSTLSQVVSSLVTDVKAVIKSPKPPSLPGPARSDDLQIQVGQVLENQKGITSQLGSSIGELREIHDTQGQSLQKISKTEEEITRIVASVSDLSSVVSALSTEFSTSLATPNLQETTAADGSRNLHTQLEQVLGNQMALASKLGSSIGELHAHQEQQGHSMQAVAESTKATTESLAIDVRDDLADMKEELGRSYLVQARLEGRLAALEAVVVRQADLLVAKPAAGSYASSQNSNYGLHTAAARSNRVGASDAVAAIAGAAKSSAPATWNSAAPLDGGKPEEPPASSTDESYPFFLEKNPNDGKDPATTATPNGRNSRLEATHVFARGGPSEEKGNAAIVSNPANVTKFF